MRRGRSIGEGADITERLRREIDNVGRPPQLRTGVYFWVWGWEGTRRALRGPFSSDEEAWRKGQELFGGNFEVIQSKYSDTAKQSQVMRNKVADETKNLDQTFRRFRHKVRRGGQWV